MDFIHEFKGVSYRVSIGQGVLAFSLLFFSFRPFSKFLYFFTYFYTFYVVSYHLFLLLTKE